MRFFKLFAISLMMFVLLQPTVLFAQEAWDFRADLENSRRVELYRDRLIVYLKTPDAQGQTSHSYQYEQKTNSYFRLKYGGKTFRLVDRNVILLGRDRFQAVVYQLPPRPEKWLD